MHSAGIKWKIHNGRFKYGKYEKIWEKKKIGFLDSSEIPDVNMRGEEFQNDVALLLHPSVVGHLFISLSVLISTKQLFSAAAPEQNHRLHACILDVQWGFNKRQNKNVANDTCINNMIYIKLLMNSKACCKLVEGCFSCSIVELVSERYSSMLYSLGVVYCVRKKCPP